MELKHAGKRTFVKIQNPQYVLKNNHDDLLGDTQNKFLIVFFRVVVDEYLAQHPYNECF